MFAKEARRLVKWFSFKLVIKISFQIIVTAMKGPYLPITKKPKIIFWVNQQQKDGNSEKKKKVIIFWVFQYFDILIGMSAI